LKVVNLPVAATTFRIPSIIHYGPGAFRELGPTARELGFRHALLVTDKGMVQLGTAGQTKVLLEEAGIRVTLFDGVQPDPTLANVEDGLAVLRRVSCDSIVAIGGGSTMDCAKGIVRWSYTFDGAGEGRSRVARSQ
jgi:alcohol dehydrogenase